MSEEKKYYWVQDFNGKISKINSNNIKNDDIINDFVCGDNYLIPQPWLGNIENPSIIILGKNPGLKTSGAMNDITDNGKIDDSSVNNDIKSIRGDLRKNLDLKNRNNSIEWLMDKTKNCWLSHWWIDKFFLDFSNEVKSLNVGIFNYYPFYSSKADGIKESEIGSPSSEIVSRIFADPNKNKNINAIIFLWKGAIDYWKDIINLENNKQKIYIANCKNPFNPRLKDIVTYEEMECFNGLDHSDKIKNFFKKA